MVCKSGPARGPVVMHREEYEASTVARHYDLSVVVYSIFVACCCFFFFFPIVVFILVVFALLCFFVFRFVLLWVWPG